MFLRENLLTTVFNVCMLIWVDLEKYRRCIYDMFLVDSGFLSIYIMFLDESVFIVFGVILPGVTLFLLCVLL